MNLSQVRDFRRLGVTVGAVGAVAVALGACGSSDSSSTGTGGGGGAAKKKSYNVVLIGALAATDDFVYAQACGAKTEAAKQGVKFKFQASTDFSAPEQITLLRNVIATKPDAIVIEPDDSAALQLPLEQAVRQGIKVVLLDTLTTNPSKFSASVSTDNEDLGKKGAQALQQLTGGKGDVFGFAQGPGFNTSVERLKGFASALKGTALKDSGAQYTQGSVSKASSITTATLARDPNLAGVFDTGGTAYEGVISVLRREGKTGKVKIVAVDPEGPRVKLLKQGVIQALIGQDIVKEGGLGVRYAVEALEGKTPPKSTILPTGVITQKNINSPEVKPFLYSHTCTS